jgi:CheY-like chemotaxis protein
MSTMSPNDPSVLPEVYGIQALSEGPTHQPHVVLWDLDLRRGDGVVVLERLKGNRLLSAIPVTGRDPEVAEQ